MSDSVSAIRDAAARRLDPGQQERFSQFLTPAPVAQQAASLFTETTSPVHILDLGAGTGILSATVAEKSVMDSDVLAIEISQELADYAEQTLDGLNVRSTVLNQSVFAVDLKPVFDRVILNPPYGKMTPVMMQTAGGDIKVTNRYTAFMVLAIEAMRDGGECVAIIPRSWMNGSYFKDFRQWLLSRCSVDAIAVYRSRQDHFKDMDITPGDYAPETVQTAATGRGHAL